MNQKYVKSEIFDICTPPNDVIKSIDVKFRNVSERAIIKIRDYYTNRNDWLNESRKLLYGNAYHFATELKPLINQITYPHPLDSK